MDDLKIQKYRIVTNDMVDAISVEWLKIIFEMKLKIQNMISIFWIFNAILWNGKFFLMKNLW